MSVSRHQDRNTLASPDRYKALHQGFGWQVPQHFNMARPAVANGRPKQRRHNVWLCWSMWRAKAWAAVGHLRNCSETPTA